jgi:hypothetical protein
MMDRRGKLIQFYNRHHDNIIAISIQKQATVFNPTPVFFFVVNQHIMAQ